ncbi:unnamed protein product [Hymenolepis diminuta]|uniref:Ubiquitin carboxyl-terminal hydrolase n=1 Tax=Hymenolepis diminuta TaxID=6216 RepID=A0A0R3SV33_HYMDI|nr:unnamed protein product [Hymenolepis diminuta]
MQLLVFVKWRAEKYDNIEVNTDVSPGEFKKILKDLTGVPEERQKVFISGALLGDESFEGIKIKNGSQVMVMGTKEELPKSIISNVVPEVDKSSPPSPVEVEPVLQLPLGLVNFGNTCYMNSAVQLLYAVPEFRAFVQRAPVSSLNVLSQEVRGVFTAIRLIFTGLSNAKDAILPVTLVEAFGKAYPQFGIQTNLLGAMVESRQQIFEQQDANECFLEFIRLLQQIKSDATVFKAHPVPSPKSFGEDSGWNPIDRFLAGKFANTLTNEEDESEPPQHTTETFLQLPCYISQEVKFLHIGLKNNLESKLQKTSQSSGREMSYKKVSRYARLPGYLCIQIMRFYYKEKTKSNTKIMKDIKFQMSLDLYDDCTDDLKTKMNSYRAKMEKMEDKEKNATKKHGKFANKRPPNPDDNPDMYEPYWLPDDLGSNNTGKYQLLAVLTHKGRGNSGHYVTWVRRSGGWFLLDDSNASQVTEDEILRLSGGGEYHSAYILLYGPARIRTSVPEAEEEMEVDPVK